MPAPLRFALWLTLATLVVFGLFAIAGTALWLDLEPAQRGALRAMLHDRTPLLVILVLMVPVWLAVLLRWWLRAYPIAAARMADEVGLIHTVDPAHRVALTGGQAMRHLGDAVNALAAAHERLNRQVQGRVDEAHVRLDEERNRLAALMAELAHGVLVCNREGRILLYNERAARLLGGAVTEGGAAAVGLGRSIFGILDKSQILHVLDKIGRRLEQQGAQPVAPFVTARGDQLLRVQMASVRDAQGEVGGFVLMLEDITRSIESDSRRERLLRQLTEGMRASLANIRAAAETVHQYPDMDATQRRRFTEVIREESERLSARLDATAAAEADTPAMLWPLEDMLAADLVYALQRSFERRLNVTAAQRDDGEALWLSVDSHALVQALTHLMGRLVAQFGLRSVVIETAAAGRFVRLSLCWIGPALESEALRQWEEEPVSLGGDGHGPTLEQLLLRHGAEIWSQADRDGGVMRLCLQLPTARSLPVAAAVSAAPVPSRPVYYDFELFRQPSQPAGLDERPLAELVCTVFDTETTGLSPSDGDEIIAIGAVRIVNGRLLRQECFDRLIRPRRGVRRERPLHGITSEMLAGQATIEQVLPMFERFAEDTVLVAHNAAFGMRFLQLAQAQTGVAFAQPVLDTLVLSALAQPGQPQAERLESLAARLGVVSLARQTALGDAIVTGEVYLKLIPLLAQRGIHTLRQAREASQQSLVEKLSS